MNNSFDSVQCEEVFSDANHVSEMELLDAAEFVDSILSQVEKKSSCKAGEVCGWVPCECNQEEEENIFNDDCPFFLENYETF